MKPSAPVMNTRRTAPERPCSLASDMTMACVGEQIHAASEPRDRSDRVGGRPCGPTGAPQFSVAAAVCNSYTLGMYAGRRFA